MHLNLIVLCPFTGELPRGMKRKATEQHTGGPDNGGEDEQDEDDEPLDRFKRGATVDDRYYRQLLF